MKASADELVCGTVIEEGRVYGHSIQIVRGVDGRLHGVVVRIEDESSDGLVSGAVVAEWEVMG